MSSAESIPVRMGIPSLWERGYRGAGVAVAVIDSGMEPGASFAERIQFDEDFTGEHLPRAAAESHEHGTSVAGCVSVVAPEAGLGNCRVVPSDADRLTRRHVIDALDHCIDVFPRYRVVNISLSFAAEGCPDECPLCRRVEAAFRKGMLVNVAAGNEGPEAGTLTCPALAKWGVANTATGTGAEEAYWREHWARRFFHHHITGRFGKTYGTSFSAGYASGAAAVMLSAFPNLSADTLRFAMLEVAATVNREAGHETTLKWDRVYSYLSGLKAMVQSHILVTKNGSLHPVIDPAEFR